MRRIVITLAIVLAAAAVWAQETQPKAEAPAATKAEQTAPEKAQPKAEAQAAGQKDPAYEEYGDGSIDGFHDVVYSMQKAVAAKKYEVLHQTFPKLLKARDELVGAFSEGVKDASNAAEKKSAEAKAKLAGQLSDDVDALKTTMKTDVKPEIEAALAKVRASFDAIVDALNKEEEADEPKPQAKPQVEPQKPAEAQAPAAPVK
jgi:hypothetical protein